MSLKIEGLLRVLRGRDISYSVRHPDYSYLDEFCCCEERHCHLPGETPKERHHYATLMIAALEMYELLKSIDEALHLDLMNFDATDHRQVYDYAKNIRVLLAKIEGGGE